MAWEYRLEQRHEPNPNLRLEIDRVLITIEVPNRTIPTSSVNVSEDGSEIITVGIHGYSEGVTFDPCGTITRHWDAETGESLDISTKGGYLFGPPPHPVTMAVSTDGSRLLVKQPNEELQIVDAGTEDVLHSLAVYTERMNDAAFSPDGTAKRWSFNTAVSNWPTFNASLDYRNSLSSHWLCL